MSVYKKLEKVKIKSHPHNCGKAMIFTNRAGSYSLLDN